MSEAARRGQVLRKKGRGRKEEEEEEAEASQGLLSSFSSCSRGSHTEIWTSSTSPFVLAVSCSVSWCCSVQQRIQSMRQFSEALDTFHICYVFLDSDPEVVPESGHSSTHTWYLAPTGSVFALPRIYRKIGFSARRLQPFFPTSPWYVAVTCSVSVQYLPRPRYTG